MQEQIQRKSTDKSIRTIIICFSPPCTFINDKLAAIRLSGGWVSIIIADESPPHLSQRLISHAWTHVSVKNWAKSIWGDKNWWGNQRKRQQIRLYQSSVTPAPPPPNTLILGARCRWELGMRENRRWAHNKIFGCHSIKDKIGSAEHLPADIYMSR